MRTGHVYALLVTINLDRKKMNKVRIDFLLPQGKNWLSFSFIRSLIAVPSFALILAEILGLFFALVPSHFLITLRISDHCTKKLSGDDPTSL